MIRRYRLTMKVICLNLLTGIKMLPLQLQKKEGIKMTEGVWEVVMFVRDHFESNQCIPEHRRLLQAIRKKHGKEKASRKYVYQMFPYGYGKQACKIAGMRVPLKLLLDL